MKNKEMTTQELIDFLNLMEWTELRFFVFTSQRCYVNKVFEIRLEEDSRYRTELISIFLLKYLASMQLLDRLFEEYPDKDEHLTYDDIEWEGSSANEDYDGIISYLGNGMWEVG